MLKVPISRERIRTAVIQATVPVLPAEARPADLEAARLAARIRALEAVVLPADRIPALGAPPPAVREAPEGIPAVL